MSIYSDKLAHVEVVINCLYSVSQLCTCEDALAHNLFVQWITVVFNRTQHGIYRALKEVFSFEQKLHKQKFYHRDYLALLNGRGLKIKWFLVDLKKFEKLMKKCYGKLYS